MQLNNAPRILPEVSEEQVSDLLIDGRIRQVLQRNNIDPDLDMFVANHFAVSLVVHNEYDITIEGIKTDLKQLVPGAISNCEYLHFNGKLHTRATWGFSFVDTQPAFGAVESKLSIGLPWHAKPDSNIILAIRAVNSSFPIRKKLLDVEPTKPHILSKKRGKQIFDTEKHWIMERAVYWFNRC